MAWSIYYRLRNTLKWSERERRLLEKHQSKWVVHMSELSDGYSVLGLADQSDYVGVTRPAPSVRAANDYVTIVEALRELEGLFPGIEAYVTDDSQLNVSARPSTIDVPRLRAQMLAQWGADGTELSGDLADLERVRPALERARADFEIWKRAQRR